MIEFPFKGGLISEIFSLCLQSPKKAAKTLSSAHYPSKVKMLRVIFWHIVLEIGDKVKNFLILG